MFEKKHSQGLVKFSFPSLTGLGCDYKLKKVYNLPTKTINRKLVVNEDSVITSELEATDRIALPVNDLVSIFTLAFTLVDTHFSWYPFRLKIFKQTKSQLAAISCAYLYDKPYVWGVQLVVVQHSHHQKTNLVYDNDNHYVDLFMSQFWSESMPMWHKLTRPIK